MGAATITPDPSEVLEISRDLECHHSVFYQLWEMGAPIFTESIETACVSFDKVGEQIGFMFNPKFYAKLTPYERRFVIAHECLHVILNHGVRSRDMRRGYMDIANVAMDVVVNHALTDSFGFDRTKLSNWKDLCWLDTVFKDQKQVMEGQSFEYYFNILKKKAKVIKLPFSLVDDHSGFTADNGWEAVIDKLNGELTEYEKESLKGVIDKHFQETPRSPAGTKPGGQWTFAGVGRVAKKKKWETVIKKWALKFVSDFRQQEQWARIHRRLTLLPTDLMLPSEMEEEDLVEPSKIEVWFFQDTSGSCAGYRDRFFTAALSLPPWRFDVKMHCFDTQVYETTLESRKLYGFGGTRFDVIETYIQEYMQKHDTKYPEAVFMITDGYGSFVKPQLPEKWYWFLVGRCAHYIPKESNVYKLDDFE